MSVTSHVQALEVKSVGTGIHGVRVDNTLGHKRQSLRGLER